MTTATTPTTGTATTAAGDALLELVTGRSPATSPWAEGAILDAVVPNWRLTRRGAAEIAGQFATWFAQPAVIEELRREPLPRGELIEFTMSWVENGIPHAARQVHVLDVDEAGRVTSDRMWCGGRWPAPLLADMEAARAKARHHG